MDYRLGPPVRVQNGGCLVRLADDARKCVVFFGTPSSPGIEDEICPWGTGFLVSTQDTGTIYMVTARHTIQDKLECPFVIRFNDNNGGSKNFDIQEAQWEFPEDETVDVAVLPITPPAWADWLPFPQKRIISPFKFDSKDIGPGDIIYTVGLWNKLYGKKRNKPFVHVGHLGMVPQDDKLIVKDWMPGREDQPVEVEGYLTEGEPLHGASGSPVFVRRSLESGPGLYPKDKNADTWVYGSVWLLGLLSDCFFERTPREFLLGGDLDIPRGVNIVVPSMKINDVLDQEKLKDRRMGEDRGRRLKSAVLPEKLASRATDENPTHLKDFTRLVDVAARKRPQGD